MSFSFSTNSRQSMTVQLSIEELPAIVGGQWLFPPAGVDVIAGIFDDSRSVIPGSLFIAIKGEFTDGHHYLPQAVMRGARAVIVQHVPDADAMHRMREAGCGCLQVADSLLAYQQLANWHLRQFPGVRVVAITGSCGKTSTKEMCASILEQHHPGGVIKTIGSTNNHFGVPRNVFRICESTRVAILEMGTNHPGEIAGLVRIAPPDVGVVCNIGHAHLEFFHDLHGVAEEKGDLLAGIKPSGVAVWSPDLAEFPVLMRKAGNRKSITFGASAQCDIRGEYLGMAGQLASLRLTWKASGLERVVKWQLGGAHMAMNAACAAAVGTALGCTADEVADGLSACTLPGARQERREVNGVTWINDAFNANPDSMRAAIDFITQLPPASPQILVLGDMLELGAGAEEAHRGILQYARQRCPDARILTLGRLMAEAADGLSDGAIDAFQDRAHLHDELLRLALPGARILLKSSHGIGLADLMPPI